MATVLVAVSMTAICGLVWSAVKTHLSSGEMEMRCVFAETGDDLEHFARRDVDDRDSAGADVRGVGAAAIVRENEHVAFGLTGGEGADDLQRFGIDDGDGLVEFSGDVELAISGADHGAVRANAVVEGDVADDFVCGDIDDGDVLAVGAGLAYAGVAVDGDEGQFAVGRGDDFMAGDAAFGD